MQSRGCRSPSGCLSERIFPFEVPSGEGSPPGDIFAKPWTRKPIPLPLARIFSTTRTTLRRSTTGRYLREPLGAEAYPIALARIFPPKVPSGEGSTRTRNSTHVAFFSCYVLQQRHHPFINLYPPDASLLSGPCRRLGTPSNPLWLELISYALWSSSIGCGVFSPPTLSPASVMHVGLPR